MSTGCNCITQKVTIMRWKKEKNWKDNFPIFGTGGYEGETYFTLHANSIEELEQKKDEIKSVFERKYPTQNIEVRSLYD